jgi:hypothetical protein
MNIFFQDPSYKNITFKSLEKGIKSKENKKGRRSEYNKRNKKIFEWKITIMVYFSDNLKLMAR